MRSKTTSIWKKTAFFTKWIQNAPLLWRSDHGTSCCKMNKDAHHTQKTTGNGMPPRWRQVCNYARQLHAKDRNPSWHLKKSSANSSWFPSPRGRRIQNERNLHTCCFMHEAYLYVLGSAAGKTLHAILKKLHLLKKVCTNMYNFTTSEPFDIFSNMFVIQKVFFVP